MSRDPMRHGRRRARARLAALVGVLAFGVAWWAWLAWAAGLFGP